MADENQDTRAQRRNFLKWGGASLLSLPIITNAKSAIGESIFGWRKNYWKGSEGSEYFVNRTVNTTQIDSGYIQARVDGWWRRFQLRDSDEDFWNWNFDERLQRLEIQQDPEWLANPTAIAGGPAQPWLATYGNRRGRGDSAFHLNNKVVYISLAPKEEYIEEINNRMLDDIDKGISFRDDLQWWIDIHYDRDLWRKDIQVAMEVFCTPEFETHTFLNLMENPVSTIGYHAFSDNNKSYELRTIAQIGHPRASNLSDYERALILHPSIQFVWSHAGIATRDMINGLPGIIFYHIEEFDNSMGPNGIRVVKRIGQELKRFFA